VLRFDAAVHLSDWQNANNITEMTTFKKIAQVWGVTQGSFYFILFFFLVNLTLSHIDGSPQQA
jgi:hypothetical protein